MNILKVERALFFETPGDADDPGFLGEVVRCAAVLYDRRLMEFTYECHGQKSTVLLSSADGVIYRGCENNDADLQCRLSVYEGAGNRLLIHGTYFHRHEADTPGEWIDGGFWLLECAKP